MSLSGKIHLGNNKDWFFSGDTIQGMVEIQSHEDFDIRGIYVILEGVAYVRWEDLDQKSEHGEIVYFMQVFENNEICLRHQINLQHNGILHKGRHEYHFSMNIPVNIPSTLTTTTGAIQYDIMLALDDAKTNHKLQQQSVRIHRRLNIDQKPHLLLPCTTHYEKHICWWPCMSRPIITSVTLFSVVFIPGDIVKYSLFIENHTHFYDVKRVSAFVVQTLQFKSQKPKQRINTDLCILNYRTHQDPCPRNSKHCIEDTFQLPSKLLTSSQESSIIMVGYRFQILVIMKGLHQDASIVIPLTIASHRVSGDGGAGDFVSMSEATIPAKDLSSELPSPFDRLDGQSCDPTSFNINETIV